MSELRKFKRIPDNIKVDYRIISLGDNPHEYFELRGGGASENISEGGMLFEVSENIPLGTFLEVQFGFEDLSYPAILRGRVIRVEELNGSHKYDLGIKFTHYFAKDRELLQEHLKNVAVRLLSASE
jgi:hypothetical protein